MLENISEEELILFASSVTIALSKCYTDEEIQIIADVCNMIGNGLGAIINRRAAIEEARENNQNIQK